MKLAKIFTPVLVLTLFASVATAGVVSIGTQQTSVPDGLIASGDGYISNDILINFNGVLEGQQIILQLDSGSIYQDDNGQPDGGPPNGGFFSLAPSLRYDTFVSIGGLSSQDSEGVLIVGAAVNLEPGVREGQIDTAGIDLTWAPSTGVSVDGGDNYPIARITLSPAAQGTLFYFGATAGGDTISLQRAVIDGVIVPEPASMALASLAVLGMVAIRRRS